MAAVPSGSDTKLNGVKSEGEQRIATDSHVAEPLDLWEKRLPVTLSDRALRFPKVIVLALVVLAAGCVPAGPIAQSGDSATTPGAGRALVILMVSEPLSLSPLKYTSSGGGGQVIAIRNLFNAGLALYDDRSDGHPYLMEAAPQLNTDTWRVFPDGGMETVYRLRPNLTWQDNTALDAEDFVFAWKTLKTPALGVSNLPPANLMDEMVALDAQTIRVRWTQPYPGADYIDSRDLGPLPRHILAQAFEEALATGPEGFLAHPYWTRDHIGLGPYKQERWEPGISIEGVAFAQHALGKPKIDRIRVLFVADPNAAVAYLLSEEAHVAWEGILGFEQGLMVQREWAARNAGAVENGTNGLRLVVPQFRPDYVNPKSLLDVRVRKALAHGIDRQGLIDALLAGESEVANTVISARPSVYPEVDRVIAKYPFDPRRVDEYMREAGFTRDSDGSYASGGERLSAEVRGDRGGLGERENAILVDGWRRLGIDGHTRILTQNEARDTEFRQTFPGLYNRFNGTDASLALTPWTTARVASAANRWVGSNPSGWSNPEFDRWATIVNGSLNKAERDRALVQGLKLLSEEVAAMPMYYDVQMAFIAAGVSRVRPPHQWNVYEWEWR